MLSFKHEVFIEVARQLSFTKASQILYISQPAVTKHIQQLEEHYKTSLFQRKGSAVVLTKAGQILFDFVLKAKAIEKQLEHEIHIKQNKFSLKGELKLGASTTVALYLIPPVLSAFRKNYPDVTLNLFNRNSESVLNALLGNEIDLAIIEGKKNMKQVHSEHFLTDEVIPVCSARSPLAAKRKFQLQEIKSIPLALRERGSGTLESLRTALSANKIKLSELKTCIRLGGTEALKNFILADECMGFLPMCTVKKELASGELVRLFIQGLTLTRQFYFAQRHGDENKELNSSFIRIAKNYYNIKL
jgi:DNA-binding transcriptional LysR family regulator